MAQTKRNGLSPKARRRLAKWEKNQQAYKLAHAQYREWLEQQSAHRDTTPEHVLPIVILDFDPERTAPYWCSTDSDPSSDHVGERDTKDSPRTSGVRNENLRQIANRRAIDLSSAGFAKTFAEASLRGNPSDNDHLLMSIEKLAKLELRKGLQGLNGNHEFAELDDVVQDTLIAAWKSLPSFSGDPTKLKAWVKTIISNKLNDALKFYKEPGERSIKPANEVPVLSARIEEQDGEQVELQEESAPVADKIVQRGIRNLDWSLGYSTTMETYSERLSREIVVNQIPGWVVGTDRAIMEFICDGRGYQEIVGILGITEGSVKMRVQSVRKTAMEDRLYEQQLYAEERRARQNNARGGLVTQAIDEFRREQASANAYYALAVIAA